MNICKLKIFVPEKKQVFEEEKYLQKKMLCRIETFLEVKYLQRKNIVGIQTFVKEKCT